MSSSGQSFSAWFEGSKAGTKLDKQGDLEKGVSNREAAEGSSESSSFIPSILRPSALFNSAPVTPPPATLWCPMLTVPILSSRLLSSDGNCGLSFAQRMQIGILLLVASLFLLGMSLFVFLPMVLLMPGKFASALSFGSLLFMTGTSCFSGIRQSIIAFLQKDKLPFVLAYFGSLLLTLYATYISQSYLLIVAAVIVQVAALLWYAATFLPGGTSMMSFLTRNTLSATVGGVRSLGSMVVSGRS